MTLWAALRRRRAHRLPAEALDRSLSYVRLLVGLAGTVLSAWSLQRSGSPVFLVGLVGSLIVCALAPGERVLRRWFAVGRLSALMTATDTVLTLLVLWLNDVQPGDPASLLLVLPLIEAGIRHGSFGVVVTWTTIALAMFGELAVTWTGAPEQAKDPMKVAMMLLVVGLPGGRLAEHLALRAHSADLLVADVANRAELLAQVLEGAAELAAVEAGARDEPMTAIAGRMLGGIGSIETVDEAATDASHHGRAYVEATDAGAAVRVELGGHPPRVLCVATTAMPDAAAVDAVELLAANFRTLDMGGPTDTATRPAGRTIEELIADRTPSDDVLDRPELDAHLAMRLSRPGRSAVGLVVVSLDNLKLMNDLHGRAAGDLLIAATTRRLTRLADATVAWVGGDDFVVVIQADDRVAQDLQVETRVALAGSVDLGRFGSTRISAGIGAAIAAPGDELTGPQLMRQATAQMVEDRREQNRQFLEAADFDFAIVEAEAGS